LSSYLFLFLPELDNLTPVAASKSFQRLLWLSLSLPIVSLYNSLPPTYCHSIYVAFQTFAYYAAVSSTKLSIWSEPRFLVGLSLFLDTFTTLKTPIEFASSVHFSAHVNQL
jgi:hypothetical protein